MFVYIQGVPEKMAQSLRPHILATVRHRVMRFSTKCPEINRLHDKSQRLNASVKYSWQVNYSKTKLTATFFLQIHERNKVHAKISFQN